MLHTGVAGEHMACIGVNRRLGDVRGCVGRSARSCIGHDSRDPAIRVGITAVDASRARGKARDPRTRQHAPRPAHPASTPTERIAQARRLRASLNWRHYDESFNRFRGRWHGSAIA
jgi:hypothetical protein